MLYDFDDAVFNPATFVKVKSLELLWETSADLFQTKGSAEKTEPAADNACGANPVTAAQIGAPPSPSCFTEKP